MSISRVTTWADQQVLTHTALNAEFDQMANNIPVAASQSDMNTMTVTDEYVTPALNKIVLGTQATTTSGTTVSFSSIPSGVRRITISFVGVSTNGTSNLILQLGDSGGIENTGYLGACTTIASATPSTSNFTASFGLTNAVAAASIIHGTITLTLENSSAFTWTCAGILAYSNAATTNLTAGSKSLSAELDRIQISAANGTDTFDAGVINVTYER